MAVITDPDSLSQGYSTSVADAAWGTPTGAEVQITSSGAGLPALAANEFFEVRDHSNSANNGLYRAKGTPTTSSVTADKVTSPNPASAVAEAVRILGKSGAANEKSVHVDTGARAVYLLEKGNVSADGATLQALYSFLKEEWKADADLIPHPFPITAVTPEQFEFGADWNPEDNPTYSIRTRKILRTGGWREIDSSAVVKREYAGVITLGSFEDPVNDKAYYQVGSDPADTGAAIDFTFAGPVNEAILSYEENVGPCTTPDGLSFSGTNHTITRANGSWIDDGYKKGGQVTVVGAENAGNNGTHLITSVTALVLTVSTGLVDSTDDNTARCARNYRNAVKVFLRIRDADVNGKTFAQSQLSDIGVTAVDNKVFRFPLSTATDLKIEETDANIASQSPYTQIVPRYFDQVYSRAVDTPGTPRSFGIVIDVGTHSGVDGSCSASGNTLTSLEGGIVDDGRYEGGTLTVHEGSNAGIYTIATGAGAITPTTVQITGTFPAADTDMSFTIQRAAPVSASAEQIYEKIQYLLRQAADIDSTDQTVTGKTADGLLVFVGETLVTGRAHPSNPNGGGYGVMIEGFSSNDTNRLTFTDNGGVERTFPFVAAGTINFNSNLQSDPGPAVYRMFFTYTERFTNTGFSLTAASGPTATLNSSTTDLVGELANGDYIRLSGFANAVNNGIWVLTGAPSGSGPWSAPIRKVDNLTVINESAGPSISVDKKPIDSPHAIIVQNNSDVDIAGNVGGASVNFDFDYDGNVQGGRTAGVDAAVTIRAIGLDTAQFVETTGLIARAVGQSFSLVAALERNYSNP